MWLLLSGSVLEKQNVILTVPFIRKILCLDYLGFFQQMPNNLSKRSAQF